MMAYYNNLARGDFSQIAMITPRLYLCGYSSLDRDRIRKLGITLIINATVEIPDLHLPGVQSIRIVVEDRPSANISMHFDYAADKIRQIHMQGGKTLVHCVAGVSRSASLCIAYLMKYERMSLLEAFSHVRQRRSVIRPNVGFWQQLIDYERQLRGTNSVRMLDFGSNGVWPDVYKNEMTNMVMVGGAARHAGPSAFW